MTGIEDRKPLLDPGPDVVEIGWFCRQTGAPADRVRSLVEAHRVEGMVDVHGRAVVLVVDGLPTREGWAALGVEVAAAYDVDGFRSTVGEPGEDEPEPGEGQGPSWTMGW